MSPNIGILFDIAFKDYVFISMYEYSLFGACDIVPCQIIPVTINIDSNELVGFDIILKDNILVSVYAYSPAGTIFNNVFVYLVVIAEDLYLGVLIACEPVVLDFDIVPIHAQAYVSSIFKYIVSDYCIVSIEMQSMVIVVFENVVYCLVFIPSYIDIAVFAT